MLTGASLAERGFEAFDGIELGMTPGARPGLVLRRAREALGASLIEISCQTRITERHLKSIEMGRYDEFHGRIYAVGFARSYARAVGVAEQAIAAAVREEYDAARGSRPMHHWA